MGFILAQGGKLHPSVIVLAAPHFLRVGGGVKFLVEKLGGGGVPLCLIMYSLPIVSVNLQVHQITIGRRENEKVWYQ